MASTACWIMKTSMAIVCTTSSVLLFQVLLAMSISRARMLSCMLPIWGKALVMMVLGLSGVNPFAACGIPIRVISVSAQGPEPRPHLVTVLVVANETHDESIL